MIFKIFVIEVKLLTLVYINTTMKIKEFLIEAEGHDQIFASVKQPHKDRREAPAMPMAAIRMNNPDYTPGKAALDDMYKKTDQFTKKIIPNKQKTLDDPIH